MKKQGDLTELKFYLRAFEEGLIVSKPFGDNTPYDFITDSGTKLNRIQVKSTSRLDVEARQNRYYLSVSHGASNKLPYSSKDIDFLIGYIIPEDAWYVIPVKQCNQRNIALYPHRNDHKGNFEEYQERWDLLF